MKPIDSGHMAASLRRSVAPIAARLEHLRIASGSARVVAVDGYSGAGKSALCSALADTTGGAIIPVDDFYEGVSTAVWDGRTVAENAKRCIDWRRLRAQAIEPLLEGRPARWHSFDWQTRKGLARHFVSRVPAETIIVDGAYSSRPELHDVIELSAFVDVPADVRRQRLLNREGSLGTWFRRWDDAERYYFSYMRPPSSFDIVIRNPELTPPSGRSRDDSELDEHRI